MSEAAVALRPQSTAKPAPAQGLLSDLRKWGSVQHEATREQMRQAWRVAYHATQGTDALPARVSQRAEDVIDARLASLNDAIYNGHAYLHTSERDLLNSLVRSARAAYCKLCGMVAMGNDTETLVAGVRSVVGTCYRVLFADYCAHLDSWLAPRAGELLEVL